MLRHFLCHLKNIIRWLCVRYQLQIQSRINPFNWKFLVFFFSFFKHYNRKTCIATCYVCRQNAISFARQVRHLLSLIEQNSIFPAYFRVASSTNAAARVRRLVYLSGAFCSNKRFKKKKKRGKPKF